MTQVSRALHARVTDAWGDPSLPLSTAMHRIANGFVETLLSVDPEIEHNMLVVVVPGAELAGYGPEWRAKHWIGSNGTVGAGPVPTWLPFEDLAAARADDDEWNYIAFLVGVKPDRSGLITRLVNGLADDPTVPLTQPAWAAGVLGTFAHSLRESDRPGT